MSSILPAFHRPDNNRVSVCRRTTRLHWPEALGFASERPDKVWGKGPDKLWCLQAGRYLLVECRNEVKAERDEIAKTETGQLNNAHARFAENYPGADVACVMVIPTKKVGEATGFNMPVRVMRENRLAESIAVLMESAPRGIDVDEVRRAMQEVPGVLAVHDLHVWSITTGLDCLSAHVVADGSHPHAALLKTLRDTLHERFGIDHLTIQVEPEGFEEGDTHV